MKSKPRIILIYDSEWIVNKEFAVIVDSFMNIHRFLFESFKQWEVETVNYLKNIGAIKEKSRKVKSSE